MNDHPHIVAAVIRSLPHWAEFGIVVIVAFGWFVLASLSAALSPPYIAWADDWGLISLVVHEIVVGAFLAWFLFVRGWRLRDLGFERPQDDDGRDALILIAVSYAAMLPLYYAMPASIREASAFQVQGELSILTSLALPIVNGIFEEVFVCAYVVSAWRGASMWNAITVSAALRIAYHAYQGPVAIAWVGPLGLIFAWYYATRGRIWPLIVAHILLDFVALLPLLR